MKHLEIDMSNKNLNSALYILNKFNLIGVEKRSSQYFYFVPNDYTDRIDFQFSGAERRFDAASVKIEVSEYYEHASKSNPVHKRRMKVIQSLLSGET